MCRDGRAAETAVMREVLQPQAPPASRREPVARGPVRPGERALAPDLARGGMLLLIVLSNTGFHLWAADHGASGWHPVGGSVLDRVVQLLMITVLDLRVYPLFAFLFGYGMMQLFLRQTAAGTSGQENALAAVRTRLGTWLFVTLAGGTLSFGGHAAMLLGLWAARRRVLEEPHHHLRMLRWTAVLGLAIGWLGGLPAALAHIGVLAVPAAAVSEQGALRLVADGTGLAGGLGYVALFGLIAFRMPAWARRHPAVVAVTAVGRRSLSCYLAHSLLMAATQRPIAASALEDIATRAAWKTIPSWTMVTTQDLAIPPESMRYMAERAGSTTVEIDASHAVTVSNPGAVADLIHKAARATTP